MNRRNLICSLIASALAVAGCNSGPNETLHAVAGKLIVDDKPVPTGNVTFYPDKQKGNETLHQPIGTINPQGRYELFVSGGRKGAPPGWYKVVVFSVDDPQPMKPNKYFVHADYASVETTSLKVEVIAEPEAGRYDWKLKK
jgi:hypothetical protein